ncbi:DNA-binding protein, partial [Spirochaetota bacterium]
MAKKRLSIIKDLPVLDLVDPIRRLGKIYLKHLHLPLSAEIDALHIALTVEYNIDYLLTWNCAHINNGDVKKRLQEYNFKHKLHQPII